MKNTKEQVKNNRFNIYLLEEGEIYIKEYLVEFKENDNSKKQGIMYLASRSFVFEPQDESLPLEKYMFKFIGNYVVKDKDNKIILKGSATDSEDFKDCIAYNSFSSNKNKYDSSFLSIFKKKISIKEAYQPYEHSNEFVTLEIAFIYEQGIRTWELIMKVIQIFQSKSGWDSDSQSILDMFYKYEFDLTKLKSIDEMCLIKKEVKVNKILPLIEVPGMLMLTNSRIYFQHLYILNSKKSYSIIYDRIKHIYRRKIKLKEVGIEIIYKSSSTDEEKTMLLEFENYKTRELIIEKISKQIEPEIWEQVSENIKLADITKKWITGEMSNYHYLLIINSAANRTRNHLSQYPIFPWVLTNYEDLDLDLKDPKNYRDLSKPIGALNENRFKAFKERYKEMSEPRYYYGTHYSTPAYVIGYLVRKHPQYMIKLQTGKFDHPDRLFSDINIDWIINYTNSGSLKELIPEFYEENTDFLVNKLNLKLGIKELSGVNFYFRM